MLALSRIQSLPLDSITESLVLYPVPERTGLVSLRPIVQAVGWSALTDDEKHDLRLSRQSVARRIDNAMDEITHWKPI